MSIKYAYTILYVTDVPKTISFYESAFGFQQKFITPEKDYAELISGETTIAFASLELGHSNFKQGFQASQAGAKPFGIELAFASEDPEQLMQQALAAGGTVLEPIVEKPWKQKVGYIQDINGFLIELCTPMTSD